MFKLGNRLHSAKAVVTTSVSSGPQETWYQPLHVGHCCQSSKGGSQYLTAQIQRGVVSVDIVAAGADSLTFLLLVVLFNVLVVVFLLTALTFFVVYFIFLTFSSWFLNVDEVMICAVSVFRFLERGTAVLGTGDNSWRICSALASPGCGGW